VSGQALWFSVFLLFSRQCPVFILICLSPKEKNGVFTGRGYAQTYEHPTTKGMKNPLTGFIAALLKCREVKNMPMFVQLRMADVHIYVYISVPLHSTSSSSPTTLNFSLQFRIWFVVN